MQKKLSFSREKFCMSSQGFVTSRRVQVGVRDLPSFSMQLGKCSDDLIWTAIVKIQIPEYFVWILFWNGFLGDLGFGRETNFFEKGQCSFLCPLNLRLLIALFCHWGKERWLLPVKTGIWSSVWLCVWLLAWRVMPISLCEVLIASTLSKRRFTSREDLFGFHCYWWGPRSWVWRCTVLFRKTASVELR